jgi:hypothetical protein
MATPQLKANDDNSWSVSADSTLEALAFVGGLNVAIEFLDATPEEIAAWIAQQKASDNEEGDEA